MASEGGAKGFFRPSGFWGAVGLVLAVVVFVDFVRAPNGPLGLASMLTNFGQNSLHILTVGSQQPPVIS